MMGSFRTAAIGLTVWLLAVPSLSWAKYVYTGSGMQPLATINPVVPGQGFLVWTPPSFPDHRWSVGVSGDFLQNADVSDDIDVIFSLTGAYSPSDRLTVGGIVPYIIRDPDFNQSDLLDLKAFARYRLTGSGPGEGIGAQVLASLPTAAQGGTFPFTLDTTTLSLTLSAATTISGWEYALNLGYQAYLDSESGDDSDLLYGFSAGKELAPSLSGVLEYAASEHTHSESSGDEKITDATALLGIKYRPGDNITLGLAVGSGMSDSYADLRSVATLLWTPGGQTAPRAVRVEEPSRQRAAYPEPPRVLGGDLIAKVKAGRGGLLIQISNRSGVKGLGEKVARHLEKQGYIVPIVEEGPGREWDTSYIYYGSGKRDRATEIKLLFGRPQSLVRVPYDLKSVNVVIVLGEDLADWGR